MLTKIFHCAIRLIKEKSQTTVTRQIHADYYRLIEHRLTAWIDKTSNFDLWLAHPIYCLMTVINGLLHWISKQSFSYQNPCTNITKLTTHSSKIMSKLADIMLKIVTCFSQFGTNLHHGTSFTVQCVMQMRLEHMVESMQQLATLLLLI